MTKKAMSEYSDDELIEELAKRRNRRAVTKPDKWCDQCAHFKAKFNSPENYNPCAKNHNMAFYMPEDAPDLENYGFYRRVCADRQEMEKP